MVRQGEQTLFAQRWRQTGGSPDRFGRDLLAGQRCTVRVFGQTVPIIAQSGREAVRLRIRPGERAEVEAEVQPLAPATAAGVGFIAGIFAAVAVLTASIATGFVIARVGSAVAQEGQRVYAEVTSPTASATMEGEEEDEPQADGDEPASQGGGEAGSEGE